MKKELVVTADGSPTIFIPEWNVCYHSRHGAVQESMHVFINAGLHFVMNTMDHSQPIHIFEMGFGTGLNAFLTAIEANRAKRRIYYTSIDAYPLSISEALTLNYASTLEHNTLFSLLHQCAWNEDILCHPHFCLQKVNIAFADFFSSQRFHLIYYDAFAPVAQPELWTAEVFKKLYDLLVPNGVLVTYCSKGDVRRAMLTAGFSVSKLPGPKWKREMLRAVRV